MPKHNRLDIHQRLEIADAIWRLFALITTKVALTFDREGMTVRVNFNVETDLDGPSLVSGVITGYREYAEVALGKHQEEKD